MAELHEIQSQDSLQTILAQLPFGLMVVDLKGTVLTCNPAAQAILESRWGWPGAKPPQLQRLPWEIQTGLEYLCKASRQEAGQSPPPALTFTSPDLYLHLSWLVLKEGTRGRESQRTYVLVALKSSDRSLAELWERPVRLTPREEEVLQWLANGKTRKEISVILKVSEATVRTHLEHLYDKLGVTNKVEAANTAMQKQLVQRLMSALQAS